MKYVAFIFLYVVILFIGMVVFGEVGRWLARRRAKRYGEQALEGTSTIDGAILALLGLVIAFTFSGALSRFDAKRNLTIRETNAIGTAYLRLDLLPEDRQPVIRENFRRYLDSRIRTYAVLPDLTAATAELENSQKLQTEIWKQTLAAAKDSGPATMLLAPALNEMFDIVTTRTMATLMHPPLIIYGMLMALAFISAAVGGYPMVKAHNRPWLRTMGFALVTSVTVYVILDIEYPRIGLFRISDFDQALIDLRGGMH